MSSSYNSRFCRHDKQILPAYLQNWFSFLANRNYLSQGYFSSSPSPCKKNISNPFSTGELKCNSIIIAVIVSKEWDVDGVVLENIVLKVYPNIIFQWIPRKLEKHMDYMLITVWYFIKNIKKLLGCYYSAVPHSTARPGRYLFLELLSFCNLASFNLSLSITEEKSSKTHSVWRKHQTKYIQDIKSNCSGIKMKH